MNEYYAPAFVLIKQLRGYDLSGDSIVDEITRVQTIISDNLLDEE